MSYTAYDRDNLKAADTMRIERTIYFEAKNTEITPLTALTIEQLQTMREESATAEQAIYNSLQGQAAAWEEQAGKTLLLDKAMEYARTPSVKHTANQWQTNEYGHSSISNMVYEMRYHVYERTRYDKTTEKSIPYAWDLSWSIRTNSPDGYNQAKISGQDKKVFGAKNDMEKYLNGRIKAYAHLFTELSPPIPQEYAAHFRVNNQLLPGYTVEGEEQKQPAHTTDIPLSTNTEQRKEHEQMGEQFSILIDSRSRFETGQPGGEWLTLPATAEQLHDAMQRVGITADNSQDFFINGFETPIEAVTRLTLDNLQKSSMDELNYLAAELSQLAPDEVETLNAAGEVLGYWDDVHGLLEYAHNKEFHVLIPGVFSPAQLGEYYLNQSEMIQIPDEWAAAIDVEKLGQLAAEHEKGQFTEHGYIVESGDQWEAVTDVPEQYRIMSYPQQENVELDAAPAAQAATMTDVPQEPRPVIPLVLNSEKPAEKLKEITDRLEQGISEIFESGRYKEYLSVMSKFHNYSFNNTLLIAMQKPDASHIAGFNSWKNEFDRYVKKDEKGIKIIAPSPFKVKKQMEKIDPNTQRPIIGKNGKPVTEEQEVTIPAFKVVSVFDVSQTEGKELPDIAVDALTGDVDKYKEFFAALEKTAPVPIGFEKMESGTHGFYHLEDKRIAIAEGMSELQTLKTTIHEIAHAKLHDIDLNAPVTEQQNRPDRRTREVEAESIAYTVCQHYGLDTSDYSFGYVAGWSSGKELSELKSSLETIRSTAAELINTIDGHIAEIQKEHTAGREQPGIEKWSEPATAENAPENPGAPSDDVGAYLQEKDNTFSIYQLKHGDETREFRFEPYDRFQAAGLTLDLANYEQTYTAPLENGMSLEGIFEKFNFDRPSDFTGHSLSVSDVVVLHQNGQDTAHYVDSFGYKDVPEFLQPTPTLAAEQQAATPAPDSFLTGETVHTPRGDFRLTAMSKQEMEAAGYGFHHQSDDGKYFIMGNGTQAFAIQSEAVREQTAATPPENPLAAVEQTTEQNANMIDGVINNTPTVDELEAKVKAGEQISLTDLADAIKADKQRSGAPKEKPSIRAQLKVDKGKTPPKKAAGKNKTDDLERS